MKYKDWIIRYGAVTRKRFTKKQKLRFLTGISQEFSNMGYAVDVKEAKLGRNSNYNLYIGDIDKAKYIVAANYDTPPSTFGLLPYKLFDENNRKTSMIISSFLPTLLLMIIGSLFILKFAGPTWSDKAFSMLDVIYTFILSCIFLIMYHVKDGIGHQRNFIRNTSSIIALLDFASSLPANQRRRVAFVLTDCGCTNCAGDKLLTERVGNKSNIIHLDSIGSSDPLYLFYPHSFSNKIDTIKEVEENYDITLFDFNKLSKRLTLYQKNEFYIASASKEGDSFCLRKDKNMESYLSIDNLKRTVKCLQTLTCLNKI